MTDAAPARGGAARHAPLRAPHRMAMGLAILSDAEWLVLDADRAADLREKRRLYEASAAQVWVETAASRPAQREVRDVLVAHLEHHHAGALVRRGGQLRIDGVEEAVDLDDAGTPPLLAASWLVQEDLCLMERDAAGAWRLTAASVCFPTRWDLPSKLGDTLTGIHDPVPGYREALAHSADRFFDGLRVGRVAVRANWSLVDDASLFQPLHGNREAGRQVTAENAGETVWLRAERQTLRRFPESDAIVFTIRVFRDPLSELADRPERARLLAEDVRTLPADLAHYKSIPDLREPVLAWLDRVGAEEGRG